MSYSIDKDNNITLTRGDTFETDITLERGEDPYVPVEGDVISFAVKHNKLLKDKSDYEDKEPLILKYVPIDTMTLVIDPEDTKHLAFGKYVYDMQIQFADGKVDTFIEEKIFELTKEVH